jgi:hypothetical protein
MAEPLANLAQRYSQPDAATAAYQALLARANADAPLTPGAKPVPTGVFWGAVVTGRVYDLSLRMQEKRNVRYAVAAELRRIVGEPVQMEHEMRQAA